MLKDHFISLLLFSALVSLFFSTLYHSTPRKFLKSFLKTFSWMVLGSLAFAFLMLLTGK
ncbi:MAG TPA: hypothetical protein PK747_00285 [Acidobacteriota bacterium]|jgi:hypothetical protein|nr:hypothetical protein [Acidobacteriota bacterium]HNT16768.1 hypothetical protein [Acidobacteriota bacterium]HPA26902.1 hypothetical protein [Acidobacteriota bacterium]HQO20020.1 hypothetical protein [Acidobacteriota bacterium]HQQ45829.1 hypothetical protein [Acidobacteriota bacterium]